MLAIPDLLEESHAKIASTLDVAGQPLPLLFQNMPYGHLRVQGQLMFGYSADPDCFLQWLHKRLGDAGQQNYDLLLDYVQPDSGGCFFCSFSELFRGTCGTIVPYVKPFQTTL